MGGGVFQYRPDDYVCSGVVADPDGHVLTSYSNVEGEVKKIVVTLSTGAQHDAQLVGFDAPLDVALLKISARDLPTPKISELKRLRLGEPVCVIGRNPDGRQPSISTGVVSALDRFAGRMVQTDADTNFSNAGGALVDERGRLIGIVCKVHTRYAATYGQNSGVGFASTWDKIAEAMPDLKSGQKVSVEKRPFLGISYDNTSGDSDGVTVSQVHPNTAADRGGIKEGDVITEFAGTRIKNSNDLVKEIVKRKAGEGIKVKVLREGAEVELDVQLGERVVEE
jgi:serine protease Do